MSGSIEDAVGAQLAVLLEAVEAGDHQLVARALRVPSVGAVAVAAALRVLELEAEVDRLEAAAADVRFVARRVRPVGMSAQRALEIASGTRAHVGRLAG